MKDNITFNRGEEIEERVVGHLFGHGAHSATAFMLLFLLNGFHCYIFALVPVYLTAGREYNIKRILEKRRYFDEKYHISAKTLSEARTPNLSGSRLSPFTVDDLWALK